MISSQQRRIKQLQKLLQSDLRQNNNFNNNHNNSNNNNDSDNDKNDNNNNDDDDDEQNTELDRTSMLNHDERDEFYFDLNSYNNVNDFFNAKPMSVDNQSLSNNHNNNNVNSSNNNESRIKSNTTVIVLVDL
jgi:hypothetical protein